MLLLSEKPAFFFDETDLRFQPVPELRTKSKVGAITMKEGMKKKNLSQEELDKLLSQLLEGSVLEENGRRLARGSVSRVAGKFGVTTRTVFRIWRQAKKNFTTTGVYAITHNKKGVCGCKPIYDDEQLQQNALALPCNKRGMIRAVANGLGISTYIAHKKKQSGVLLSHTNAILLFLSEPNKFVRVLYAAISIEVCVNVH